MINPYSHNLDAYCATTRPGTNALCEGCEWAAVYEEGAKAERARVVALLRGGFDEPRDSEELVRSIYADVIEASKHWEGE